MPEKIDLKYHIITFGCQMNKSDSERVKSILERIGFRWAERERDADFILLNTCSVRQKAEDRVYGMMRKFAEYKKEKPHLLLAVTGCMPGRDKDGALRKRLPMVDFFFPIDDAPQLPKWIAERNSFVKEIPDIDEDYLSLRPEYTSRFQAFVPIQTGCNQFCTYCVVPQSRGMERYRPVGEVLDEIRHLDAHGYKEVTILGQTVNSYRPKDSENFSKENPYQDAFAALLWEINRLPNIKRIHFTAPHPNFMSDGVIDAMALPNHVNYLHLPAQCGNDEILKRMNRKYTAEQYLEKIKKVRERIPNIALGTDIIVGFCGETEAQFEETVRLYKEADFDISYTAMYSERSGTGAAKAFKDDVNAEEKKRRWWKLQELMEKTTFEKNQKYKNTEVSVLVERCDGGVCSGNSREMKLVQFPGAPSDVGAIVPVKIERAEEWVLVGKRV